jgi:hypothetical protein
MKACGSGVAAAMGFCLVIGLLSWRQLEAAPLVGDAIQGDATPSDPTRDGRSLAPIDGEAFRTRYGQEALFRLRLGVDAVRDVGNPHPAAAACPPFGWSESPERARYEGEVAAGRYFLAGQSLGAWQFRVKGCSAGGR